MGREYGRGGGVEEEDDEDDEDEETEEKEEEDEEEEEEEEEALSERSYNAIRWPRSGREEFTNFATNTEIGYEI
jgi:hypothetical protein